MGQQRFTTGRRIIGVVVLAATASMAGIGTASAAPVNLPAPLARLAEATGHDLGVKHARSAKQVGAGERQALRADEGDDESFVDVEPGCASGTGKAKVRAYVYTPKKLKADYELTGTGLVEKGSVTTKSGKPVSFGLPSLRTGAYRLVLTVHGKSDVVGDTTFDVLPCVSVKASCAAVTFTNPAGNPAAYGLYSNHSKSQDFEIDLAPGASITVRVDDKKLDYDLSADDEQGSSLGRGTVKVKQSCSHGAAQPDSHAIQTTGFVGCAQPGAQADVQLSWSAQPSLKKPTYEVLGAPQVVAGKVRGGHEADLTLPAGSYTYRSHANGLVAPFEDVSFVVLACVEVTPRCKAVEVRNPNDVAVAVSLQPTVESESDEGDYATVTVDPGATVTVPWSSTTVDVLAYLDDPTYLRQAYFLSLGSPVPWDDEDLPVIEVPQDC